MGESNFVFACSATKDGRFNSKYGEPLGTIGQALPTLHVSGTRFRNSISDEGRVFDAPSTRAALQGLETLASSSQAFSISMSSAFKASSAVATALSLHLRARSLAAEICCPS